MNTSATLPFSTAQQSQIYDLLVIGTSPMSLMEAAQQASLGKKVGVVDRETSIGGAWRTEDCLGLEGVETTPHIFVPDRQAYRLLERYMGGDFLPIPLEPYLQVVNSVTLGDRKVPIRQSLEYLATVAAFTFLDNRLRRSIKYKNFALFLLDKYGAIALQRKARRALYPRNGLSAWFTDVGQKFAEKGIDVHMQTEIRDLSCADGIVTLRCGQQQELKAHRICINRSTSLEQVVVDGQAIPIENQSQVTHHFTYIVKTDESRGFVQVIGHKLLHLINDVSDYAPDLNTRYPGCKLITARIHQAELPPKEQAEAVFKELQAIGYLNAADESLHWHHRQLRVPRMKPESTQAVVNSLGSSVVLIEAGDLSIMESIRQRYG